MSNDPVSLSDTSARKGFAPKIAEVVTLSSLAVAEVMWLIALGWGAYKLFLLVA
jgi:hypothetical protein